MNIKMLIFGLGSNKGNRKEFLEKAINELSKEFTIIKRSKIYSSKALLKDNSPKEWDIDFLNMAILCKSNKDPFEILGIIKDIENKLGRKKEAIWSPREIDIDILCYNDHVINNDILTIPHKELLNRDFALIPLLDLVPNWVHPKKEMIEIDNNLTEINI